MKLRIIAEEHDFTLAVDLDGTLAKKKDYHTDKILDPVPDAKEIMQKVRDLGVKIIVFTVRGDKKQIETWLEKHEIEYDYINNNPNQPKNSSGKIIADEYWDDRAAGWPGLRKALAALKRKLNA